MLGLFATIALLTVAGVAGLVAVLVALYAFSIMSEAVSSRRNKDKEN